MVRCKIITHKFSMFGPLVAAEYHWGQVFKKLVYFLIVVLLFKACQCLGSVCGLF